MITIQEIRESLTALSGSGKKVVSTRRNGLYTSMTLPGLNDMLAVRDTLRRFADFGVPPTMNSLRVIDVGCNVGGMAFEFAQRGAFVTGVEYRADRVALCRLIAQHWNFTSRFFQSDFNDLDDQDQDQWMTPQWYDAVLCSSVDEYVTDVRSFYDMIVSLLKTEGILYFECNVQRDQSVEETIAMLKLAGLSSVEYLGSGHSGGISRKRKIYKGVK